MKTAAACRRLGDEAKKKPERYGSARGIYEKSPIRGCFLGVKGLLTKTWRSLPSLRKAPSA